ncbi:hypothetical protein [Mycolicibacter arupensis]|jgi:hypothetical protein|uniref:Uncharacterized protein n=1 Tax=Mycolicibacter arupensis TaxID=342002 RepID=A0A5C7XUZ9_9MYCO|nr:hypothetical protein [Mycolicibacter arupensis]TXI53387.1 MAG: hypothetical protein E6Q54_16545 [Mycolicibacter arupensis]
MTQQQKSRPGGDTGAASKSLAADYDHGTATPVEQAWYATPIPMAAREIGDQRYHTAPVGLGARTFREGFARGGRDALRRVWCILPAELRGQVAVIAADYGGDDD